MSDLQQYFNNRKEGAEFAQKLLKKEYQALKSDFFKTGERRSEIDPKRMGKKLNLRAATISRIENHSETSNFPH
jgi:hypothetical protein